MIENLIDGVCFCTPELNMEAIYEFDNTILQDSKAINVVVTEFSGDREISLMLSVLV